jgi:hypothetical protein
VNDMGLIFLPLRPLRFIFTGDAMRRAHE